MKRNKTYTRRILMLVAILMCMMIPFCDAKAYIATPRLMVTDYKTNVDDIYPNQPFQLTVHFDNTSKVALSNIKVTLSSEENRFVPSEGVTSAFIETVAAGEGTDLTFSLQPIAGLLEQTYSVTVKTEYENGKGESFTSEDSIYLPITLEKRIAITDLMLDKESAQIGDMVELSANVNNMGECTLYHVFASVEGDNVTENESYIGNIEAGKSGSLDVLVKADVVSEGDHVNNKVILTYEDQAGKSYETEYEFRIKVDEPIYTDLEKIKEEKDASGIVKTILMVIVFIIIVVGVVYFIMRRVQKKKQMLEDFLK